MPRMHGGCSKQRRCELKHNHNCRRTDLISDFFGRQYMALVIELHLDDVGVDSTSMAIPTNSTIPAPPLIPPAPPLPKHFPIRKYRDPERDNDSGRGSLFNLPCYDLSDDEFSDIFSSSAPISRRGSGAQIPIPPPVPPLPRYLTGAAAAPAPAFLIELQLQFDQENPYGIFDDDDDYYGEYTCIVCFTTSGANFGHSSRRNCCNQVVCRDCMLNIVHTQIGEGLVHLACPNPECDAPVGRKEILGYLSEYHELKERYERMRLEADGDENKKTCPNCCFITEHELPRFKKPSEDDVKISCVKCKQEWCFACHAPWHQDMTCKQFRKGNRLFSKWTKGRSSTGVANCQKCPLCRVYIQRSTGCDHMTCNRCDTHFCYKCGGRFMEIPGLGDHYTKTSILGCKFNYEAQNPVKRKAVRGGYFGAKMAMLTGYPVLFVAGAAVVVTVGAVVLPVYGGYRLYKFHKNARKRRRRRRH